MTTTTWTTESRYPARSMTATEFIQEGVHQPVGASTRELASTGRKRNSVQQQQQQQQLRRIPALTASRTFGEKSPVVNADIQAFLATCMNMSQWETYTAKEKAMIMNSLPETRQPQSIASSSRSSSTREENDHAKHNTNRDMLRDGQQQQSFEHCNTPPLSPTFFGGDPYLKRAIARFKRELSDGYYTKVWQDKAKRAHDERMDGNFDDYLAEHAEGLFPDEGEGSELAEVELAEETEDEEYQDGTHKRRRDGQAR